MGVAQLTDSKYYQDLVDKDAIGFSIEGFLGMKEVTKLNQINMQLPDGEHLIDGKIYVVKDGVVIEIKDEVQAMEEPTVEEEVAMAEEEVKEEEMAEEVVEEVVEEEMAENATTITDEHILKVVQPKIDELIDLIAEVKGMITTEETEEEAEVEMSKMSAHDRLKSFMNFNKQNK